MKEGRSNASDTKSKTQRTRSFTIDITMVIIVAPKSLMPLAQGIFLGNCSSSLRGQELLNKFLRDFFYLVTLSRGGYWQLKDTHSMNDVAVRRS